MHNFQHMKKSLARLTAILLLSLPFFACSKDDDENPSGKTKTELISQSTWKFSGATAGGTDASSFIDACYKDNILTFNANGTGNVNESVIVCSPSTAGTFTWTFQSGETDLNVSASLFPGGAGTFDIVTLSETTLVIAQDMTFPPFPTTNVQITFVH